MKYSILTAWNLQNSTFVIRILPKLTFSTAEYFRILFYVDNLCIYIDNAIIKCFVPPLTPTLANRAIYFISQIDNEKNCGNASANKFI